MIITVTPDKGYELDEIIVTDKNGDELKLTEKSENWFTFKRPASKVSCKDQGGARPSCPLPTWRRLPGTPARSSMSTPTRATPPAL